MKLKTLIIDDEPIALEKLRNYAEKVSFIEPVVACDNSLDALDRLVTEKFDLVITDIEMPDLNGMDMIAGLTAPPLVIFTTAYVQYAVESYRVKAVDYLLKPFGFAEFPRAVNRALDSALKADAMRASTDKYTTIFVKTDTRYIKVSTDDILYIKGFGEYLQIYVKDKENPLVTLSSFAAVRDRLTPNFLQIHRSYIVNMDNIRMAERNHVIIGENTFIPVSDGYRTDFINYLNLHSVGRNTRK